MITASLYTRHLFRQWPRVSARSGLWTMHTGISGQFLSRCFSKCSTLPTDAQQAHSVHNARFIKDFKASYDTPIPTFAWPASVQSSRIGSHVVVTGFLHKIVRLGDNLLFAHIRAGNDGTNKQVQVVCREAELCSKLHDIRLGSPVNIGGTIALKRAPKTTENAETQVSTPSIHLLADIEIRAGRITCLNDFPADIHHGSDHVFPPQDRHLQIRYDNDLVDRLYFRAHVADLVRHRLRKSDFIEIETPILFKSTPEGAKEFLVPTRKQGHAYALPQSPQQYKQILMASGIPRYFQFARCFRDEDLRADRQPEFTQIDLEMAFTDGEGVMRKVETLLKWLYDTLSRTRQFTFIQGPGPIYPFHRVTYQKAMSKYGSDKPDLRLKGLIHCINQAVPAKLKGMITSVKGPIIEAFKMRLHVPPEVVHKFVEEFLKSPEAGIFMSNPCGQPGICVYDLRKPLDGLAPFEFEGSQSLKDIYSNIAQQNWEDAETHEANRTFSEGDLLIFQARERLPHSGGSTMLGKLRLALEKFAIAKGYIEQDQTHNFLWVTNFPMFTPENGSDPGQGGSAGFSATHHPFTAPKSRKDIDLLLWKPLQAEADHFDLVLNGVELGGGSRRIHNAAMQEFVMRDILKMKEERINDFEHLLKALRAGCPPHAGMAIGFDRLIAVMTGRESVKDVIAFPKSSKGEDMMIKSPAPITSKELQRYGLELRSPSTGA